MCVCGLLPGGSRAGEDGGRTSKKELRRREEIRGSTCFPLWHDRVSRIEGPVEHAPENFNQRYDAHLEPPLVCKLRAVL